jgi:Glyoxalase-like domain
MSQTKYTRLRQVCLATNEIKKHQAALGRIFDLSSCHEGWLEEFGLENALFAMGGSFIEFVAPIRTETAVDRFLARSKGRGAYMAIFDCENIDRRKEAANALGISPVFERKNGGADLLQLNPRQTGLTLLEFDTHKNGTDRFDGYEWAGPNWQEKINQELVTDITGFTFQCSTPELKASMWSEMMGYPAQKMAPDIYHIELEYGLLKFIPAENGHECFSAITLTCPSPDLILERAQKEGYHTDENSFHLCGVDIVLT